MTDAKVFCEQKPKQYIPFILLIFRFQSTIDTQNPQRGRNIGNPHLHLTCFKFFFRNKWREGFQVFMKLGWEFTLSQHQVFLPTCRGLTFSSIICLWWFFSSFSLRQLPLQDDFPCWHLWHELCPAAFFQCGWHHSPRIPDLLHWSSDLVPFQPPLWLDVDSALYFCPGSLTHGLLNLGIFYSSVSVKLIIILVTATLAVTIIGPFVIHLLVMESK